MYTVNLDVKRKNKMQFTKIILLFKWANNYLFMSHTWWWMQNKTQTQQIFGSLFLTILKKFVCRTPSIRSDALGIVLLLKCKKLLNLLANLLARSTWRGHTVIYHNRKENAPVNTAHVDRYNHSSQVKGHVKETQRKITVSKLTFKRTKHCLT